MANAKVYDGALNPNAMSSANSALVNSLRANAANASLQVAGGKDSKGVKGTKGAKQADKKAPKKAALSKKPKKGGAIMDDIKNLAVPFAILLAKQGLESSFEKKSIKADNSNSTQKKNVLSTSQRRRTMTGGSGGEGCLSCGSTQSSSMSGGAHPNGVMLQKRFNNIAREIEEFLSKY